MKKIEIIRDYIFYGLIALSPIIAYLVAVRADPAITFTQIMQNIFNFGSSDGYYTYGVFDKFFNGVTSYLPFLNGNTSFIAYLTYLVFIEFAHLLIDILCFLPRLFHTWIDGFGKFCGGKHNEK